MVRHYPRIHNSDFKSICLKKEFTTCKITNSDDSKMSSNSLLLPHQQFAANYINPSTPYRGLLVFHETGTGKTCTAVSIAENFKSLVKNKKNRIKIISSENVKNEFKKTIKSTETKFKCTGDTYLKELGNNKEELTKEQQDSKLNDIINNYYDFTTYQNFGNNLLKQLKNLKDTSIESCKKYISNQYSDAVYIVDEVHNLRSNQKSTQGELDTLQLWVNNYIIEKNITDKNQKVDKNKISADAIDIITKYSKNIRLVFLSATPMFDSPVEIIWLVNMLIRVNEDTISELSEKEIFDSDYNFRNKQSILTFRRAIRGKISYLRSGDPRRFPLRIESEEMFTVSQITDSHHELIMSSEFPDLGFSIIQLHNIAWYSQNDQLNGLESHFNISLKKNPAIYEFKAKSNLLNELETYAPKIKKIVEMIEGMTDGIVLVYSKYVWGGIVPIMLALENIGYSQYSSKNTSGKKLLKGSPDIQKMYSVITSTPNICVEKQDTIIKVARSKENKHGKQIRVILATPAGGEGIDLKNIRQVHILEPHYNYSQLEQVIGRAIRTDSHIDLDDDKRNCTVFYHVTKHSKEYGVEKKIYDLALKKRNGINSVRKLLQEESVSCGFFKEGNEFKLSDLKGKLITNSFGKKIKYNPIDESYDKVNCSFCNDIGNSKIDSDTYHPLIHSKSQVHLCIKWISELFEISSMYVLTDIIKIIKLRNNKFDKETILFALDTIIKNRTFLITNEVGIRGRIIFDTPYYKFVSEHSEYSGRYNQLPFVYANTGILLKDIPLPKRPRINLFNIDSIQIIIDKYLSSPNFMDDKFWDISEMKEIRNNLLAQCIIDKLSDNDRFHIFNNMKNQTKHVQYAISKYITKSGFLRVKNTSEQYTFSDIDINTDNTIPNISREFPNSKQLPLCGFINYEKNSFIFKVLDRRTTKGTGANLGSAGDTTKKKLLDVINSLIEKYCHFKKISLFKRYINDKETITEPPSLNAGLKSKSPTNQSLYIECEMLFRLLSLLKVDDKHWFISSWETYDYALPNSAKK